MARISPLNSSRAEPPPTEIVSWSDLARTLQSMPAEREAGFEGLSAALLANLTGRPFSIARTGEQLHGDALSADRGISIQAKRYAEASKLDEKQILGDALEIRHQVPGLDVLVLTVTRDATQLREKLKGLERETGLDIVLLTLVSNQVSDLGALCVADWDTLCRFFPIAASPKSRAWAERVRQEATTTARLHRLRETLRHGLHTRLHAAEAANRFLDQRFGLDEATVPLPVGLNQIKLREAVDRCSPVSALEAWWREESSTVAYLQADEGYGKTWVAASFADRLRRRPGEGHVVFWLDSLKWHECRDVESVISAGLETAYPPQHPAKMAVLRKVFRLWNRPVLVVLDGVNERGGLLAAKQILLDLFTHQENLRGRVRLLFTSRPLDHREEYDHALWRDCRGIPLSGFSDEEFTEALHRFAPGVGREEIAGDVQKLASVPRYFRICLRLRELLGSLRGVDKPTLLWADLQDKIENASPQLRRVLGGADFSGVQEVLSRLAAGVNWEAGTATAPRRLLDEIFSDYHRVRDDLVEQRVVLRPGWSTVTIGPDHVILGTALLFRAALEAGEASDPEGLRLNLLAQMEPVPSQDLKAEALYAALLLTALSGTAGATNDPNVSIRRAVLLDAWLSHHNARLSPERLEYWAKTDPTAYCHASEFLFESIGTGDNETAAILPLAHLWRDGDKTARTLLNGYLEKWLKLIFATAPPNDVDAATAEIQRRQFVPAANSRQLRLSYVAISLLSVRPEVGLLTALALCAVSSRHCGSVERHASPEGVVSEFRIPLKAPFENLGKIMRWRYTEAVQPELDALAAREPGNALLREGVRRLRGALELRAEGRREAVAETGAERSREKFEQFRAALANPDTEENVELTYADYDHLTVQATLPALSDDQTAQLRNHVGGLIDRHDIHSSGTVTAAGTIWDKLLPWLARTDPAAYLENLARLQRKSLGYADPHWMWLKAEGFCPAGTPAAEVCEEILHRREAITALGRDPWIVSKLTEVLLLCGNADQLRAWFLHLEGCQSPEVPIFMDVLPLPGLIARLLPPELGEFAFTRLQAAFEDSLRDPDDLRAVRGAKLWSALCSTGAATVVEWSLGRLSNFAPDHPLYATLLRLAVFKSGAAVHAQLLGETNVRAFLRQTELKPVWARWLHAGAGLALPASFAVRSSELPFGLVGELLLASNRDDELRIWAANVGDSALRLLEEPPFVRTARDPVHREVATDGMVISTGPDHTVGEGHSWHSATSPIWGVDHSAGPSPWQAEKQFTHENLDVTQKSFREEQTALASWEGHEFTSCYPVGPFHRWATLQPAQFLTFAKEFLGCLTLKSRRHFFTLGTLGYAVLEVLLSHDPELANHYFARWQGSSDTNVRVTTHEVDLPAYIAALWTPHPENDAPLAILRRRLLEEAHDDEEIFWQVFAARMAGSNDEVRHLAEQYANADLARERALAVSLLGFSGTADALDRLEQIMVEDASSWVRKHAAWASSVCQQQLDCARVYHLALEQGNFAALVVACGQIHPALDPMARCWRRETEREANWSERADPRAAAYAAAFWFHWGSWSNSKRGVKLFNRALNDYCRGEDVKRGVASRLAPWWKVDPVSSAAQPGSRSIG